jgi:hypothetical protein
MQAERFFTHSLRDPRVARILAAALDAVEPGAAVGRYLSSNPLSPGGCSLWDGEKRPFR